MNFVIERNASTIYFRVYANDPLNKLCYHSRKIYHNLGVEMLVCDKYYICSFLKVRYNNANSYHSRTANLMSITIINESQQMHMILNSPHKSKGTQGEKESRKY